MSSDIAEKVTLVKEDEENEKIKEINKFSRNFNKYYYKIKVSQEKEKKKEKNNKSKDSLNKDNEIENNKLLLQTTTNKNNSEIFNSLVEFDILNNTSGSGSQQKTKADTNPIIKTSKKSQTKKNKPSLHLSSSRDNLISSNNIIIQTTTVQSTHFQHLKNKYLGTQKKSGKRKKDTKSLKNLKKNFSQKRFDSFLKRVKEKQKMKELHLNNIRSRSLETETSEMNIRPEINKISLSLLKKNNRKPLYQKRPLNEEKNLEKNFQDFYNKSLKESQTNTYKVKSPKKNNNKTDEYQKFYDDKMRWKKNVEQKNKNRKLNKDQIYDEYLDNFPFKPYLDKNSINIANKLYRNRSIENNINFNFYENGNDIESLDKFKIKLKPLITNIYNDNNYNRIYLNKKNHHRFKRNLSEIYMSPINNVNMEDNTYKNNNNRNNKNKIKINYKLNEKKYCQIKVNDINKKEDIKDIFRINEKNNNYRNQLEGMKKQKIPKDIKQDLYKLNVRPGTSWNFNVINKVTSIRKCEKLIKEFF